MRNAIIALIATTLIVPSTAVAADWTLRADVRGQRIEGTPLSWSDDYVNVLGRDGRLWSFPPSDAKNFSKVSPTFRSYSQSDLRRQLLSEFGQHFDVSGTGQFLIVHPVGQRDLWASRFEDLYRSFVYYFTVRGLRPKTPQFPFIAVVFNRQSDFMKYSAQNGMQISSQVLGYYSLNSNRVLLYDRTAGSGSKSGWQQNAATIIHEAAHQSAFNTGIHSRFSPPPRWVAEGLGTLFEANGVWDSRQYTRRSDRINRGRFLEFKNYAASRRRKGSLAELIASDRIFQMDPGGAYSESWALTFYLTETQPKQYFQYLAKTASRPPFTKYDSPNRLKDFVSVFGNNFIMLEARMLRFIAALE